MLPRAVDGKKGRRRRPRREADRHLLVCAGIVLLLIDGVIVLGCAVCGVPAVALTPQFLTPNLLIPSCAGVVY